MSNVLSIMSNMQKLIQGHSTKLLQFQTVNVQVSLLIKQQIKQTLSENTQKKCKHAFVVVCGMPL